MDAEPPRGDQPQQDPPPGAQQAPPQQPAWQPPPQQQAWQPPQQPQPAWQQPPAGPYGPQPYGPTPYGAPAWGPPAPPPGYPPLPAGIDPRYQEKKVVAGICGILVGAYGVHKFILGYKSEGIIMLASSVGGIVLGFIGFFLIFPMVLFLVPSVMGVIGLIEGIMYLTKSDYDFVMTYGVNRKPWF